MLHSFEKIDDFLSNIEKDIIDCLYDYGLLSSFSRDVKKIIFYIFVKKINQRIIDNGNLLFYHDNNFSDNHELFQYFDKQKTTNFLNKICDKIRKVTNKIFYIKEKTKIPSKAVLHDLEGSVIDEILLLKEKKDYDLKKLKEFLKQNNLKDLFDGLSKKIT